MTRPAGIELTVNDDPGAAARVIYLGVPTFGMVSIKWHAHLLGLQNPLNRPVCHAYALGFEVGQARNYLVEQALHWRNDAGHTVSHVFFVDDEVLIPPYALSVLLSRNRPIVSGLYYAKTPTPQPLILMGPGQGTPETVPHNQVVDCFAHGMGCTLIAREVFERMQQELDLGVDASGHPQWYCTLRNEPTTNGVARERE